MLPMQPGDVPATYADVEDLTRDVGFRPATRSKMVSRDLRNGIATTTGSNRRTPMNKRIIPLIMCGGAGTRLWPASREVHPKQFLPLFGARSTFQETLLRVSDAALFERPIVITNTAYRFMVLEQLAEIGLEADVLLEPMRRDSGPAIAAGAAFAQTRDKEAVVLALAADHVVADNAGLRGRLPRGASSCGSRAHRDLRRAARTCRHRIRLYQPRRHHLGPGSQRCQVRREAGSGNGRRLHQGRLSLEQRQLHVSCLGAAR